MARRLLELRIERLKNPSLYGDSKHNDAKTISKRKASSWRPPVLGDASLLPRRDAANDIDSSFNAAMAANDRSSADSDLQNARCEQGANLVEDDPSSVSPRSIPTVELALSGPAHAYLIESLRRADQVAMFFLAISAAVLAFLIDHRATAHWLSGLGAWSFVDLIGFLSVTGIVASACMMIAVLYTSFRESGGVRLFLEAMTEPDRPGESSNTLHEESHRDRLAHIFLQDFYDLYKVHHAKYRSIRYGFWIGVVSASLSLLFLALMQRHNAAISVY